MKILSFSRINTQKGKFIYVHQNKQLYLTYKKNKNNTVYKCRSKNCESKISIKGDDCVFKTVLHNHNDNAQSKYFELKSWQKIDNYIQTHVTEVKNGKIKPRKVFDLMKRKYVQFNLDYEKNKQTIRNKLNKFNIIYATKKQQGKILLNARGKELLSIDDKYKHLFEEPKLENREDDLPEFESKTVCKICFAKEADTRLDPCGHILCENCILMIYNMERKKLERKYRSKRMVENKIKINCYKCRAPVKTTQKIFY